MPPHPGASPLYRPPLHRCFTPIPPPPLRYITPRTSTISLNLSRLYHAPSPRCFTPILPPLTPVLHAHTTPPYDTFTPQTSTIITYLFTLPRCFTPIPPPLYTLPLYLYYFIKPLHGYTTPPYLGASRLYYHPSLRSFMPIPPPSRYFTPETSTIYNLSFHPPSPRCFTPIPPPLTLVLHAYTTPPHGYITPRTSTISLNLSTAIPPPPHPVFSCLYHPPLLWSFMPIPPLSRYFTPQTSTITTYLFHPPSPRCFTPIPPPLTRSFMPIPPPLHRPLLFYLNLSTAILPPPLTRCFTPIPPPLTILYPLDLFYFTKPLYGYTTPPHGTLPTYPLYLTSLRCSTHLSITPKITYSHSNSITNAI